MMILLIFVFCAAYCADAVWNVEDKNFAKYSWRLESGDHVMALKSETTPPQIMQLERERVNALYKAMLHCCALPVGGSAVSVAFQEVREEALRCERESENKFKICLLYTSPSPRDRTRSRMPSSA